MQRFFLYMLFCVTGMFLSCSNNAPVQKSAYVELVTKTDQGLIQEKKFGDTELQLFYQPLEYLYIKESKKEKILEKEFEEWKKGKEDYDYFILRIKNKDANELSNAGSANMNEYAAKLDYFMNDFEKDIQMLVDNDTIPCALMHYERNFGLSPNNNFNIMFTGAKKFGTKERTVIVDLSVLDIGNVKFRFEEETIKNSPKLIFDL